jgi:geranylgeranyl pyrophosphate synthase
LARTGLAPADRTRLERLLRGKRQAGDVAEMLRLITASGAPAQVETLIESRLKHALTALDGAALPHPAALEALATTVTQRNR